MMEDDYIQIKDKVAVHTANMKSSAAESITILVRFYVNSEFISGRTYAISKIQTLIRLLEFMESL